MVTDGVSQVEAGMARKVREGLAWSGAYPTREMGDDGDSVYVQRARRSLCALARKMEPTDMVALFRAAEVMWRFDRLPCLFEQIEAMDIPVR